MANWNIIYLFHCYIEEAQSGETFLYTLRACCACEEGAKRIAIATYVISPIHSKDEMCVEPGVFLIGRDEEALPLQSDKSFALLVRIFRFLFALVYAVDLARIFGQDGPSV